MARTYRNRHTVPNGWTVLDGGRICHHECRGRCNHYPRYLFSRSWFNREPTYTRRLKNRAYRNRSNHLTRTERWDDILPPRRDGGWDTW